MPTAIELAKQFQASLVGEGSLSFDSLAPIEQAQSNQITFLSNPLYRQDAIESAAGALILSQADYEFLKDQAHSKNPDRIYFISKNPYAMFAKIAQLFAKTTAPH